MTQTILTTEPAYDPLLTTLKQRFGHEDFRPMQRQIIEDAMQGRDILAILPTGAGKSLCYQLPAVLREGATLVVSPLIALMADQLKALEANGIRGTVLNSSVPADEIARREAAARRGEYNLIYLAPERLMGYSGQRLLQNVPLNMIAIDEAHCISEWGHDFRPEYRQVGLIRERFNDLPFMALTATATPRVAQDIATQLHLHQPAVHRGGFERPNLFYQVRPKQRVTEQIMAYLEANPLAEGIIYCHSRRQADELSSTLASRGVEALPYHAGLNHATRERNQHAFIYGKTRVMVATIAFGMGVDKPDVRFVIHADLPRHIEGYYQETGRAGRDGEKADCILFFSHGDCAKIQRFIDEKPDAAEREHAQWQLQQMVQFAYATSCRTIPLMAHFGQEHPGHCQHCDNCLEPPATLDITNDARKMLSAVARLGQRYGVSYVVDILRGQRSERSQSQGHESLSVFGIGADQTAAHWRRVSQTLLLNGQLAQTNDEYPIIHLIEASKPVLRGQQEVRMIQPRAMGKQSIRKAKGTPRGTTGMAEETPYDERLFEVLRQLRYTLAQEQNVPPYVVFSDAALRDMARRQPVDMEQFIHVSGVGEHKRSRYGQMFTDAIRQWLDGKGGV
jgi:ATP-dependent DNA helicase RecQ